MKQIPIDLWITWGDWNPDQILAEIDAALVSDKPETANAYANLLVIWLDAGFRDPDLQVYPYAATWFEQFQPNGGQ